jgi:hypothetical protein
MYPLTITWQKQKIKNKNKKRVRRKFALGNNVSNSKPFFFNRENSITFIKIKTEHLHHPII